MKKILLSFALAATVFATHAQNYLHQVVIVNEGRYDYVANVQTVPVSVGVYNPLTRKYKTIDIISGSRYASDVKFDGKYFYVAADNKIIKYDADNYTAVGTINVSSVRKLAVYNNQLLATRGEVGGLNSYLQLFDKNTLQLIKAFDTITGPKYAAESMIVRNDSVYVGINNAFDWNNYKGIIAVVDLKNQTVNRNIILPNGATNPENMMFDGVNIHTLNNNDFTQSSVSTIDLGNVNAPQTHVVVSGNGCSTSSLTDDGAGNYSVLFQAFGDVDLGRYDVAKQKVIAPLKINKGIYGIEVDPTTGNLYTGVTDFTSYGKIYIHSANGSVLDSFTVNVSPGNIAFDVRLANGINKISSNNFSVAVYPNPANSQIQLVGNFETVQLYIVDVTGKEVLNTTAKANQSISVEHLNAGIYFVKSVNANGETVVNKLIKE